MSQHKTYTLTTGEVVTAQILAKRYNINKSTIVSRLRTSLDPVYLQSPTSSLFNAIAKVWSLSGGIKGTVVELSELSGVTVASLKSRLKKSQDHKVVLKPKSDIDIGKTNYHLFSGEVIKASSLKRAHEQSALDLHFEMLQKSQKADYFDKRYFLSNGKEITIQEVMDRAGVGFTTAKSRLEKSRNPDVIFKPSIRPSQKNVVKNRKKQHKKIAVGSYHMCQCPKTGAIRLSSL